MHKSLLEEADGEIRSLCKFIPSARAPWSVALFCECDKATLLQWHEEKRAYNQAGNTMQSTALKTLHVIFAAAAWTHWSVHQVNIFSGKCVWIPCLLASEAWHHLFQRQPMGAQHIELPEDWARCCLGAASHPSVWFASGTDQNQRRSTHGKDLRAES